MEVYKVADSPEEVFTLEGKTRNKRVSNPFRDSLVTNLSDMVEILPALNVTNDPELEKFAELAKKELLFYTAEDLRQSSAVRQVVIDKADEILKKMSDYV